MSDSSILLVLDAEMPFVRHPEAPGCVEESWLFNAISFTYLPLLRSCTALETEGVSFKLAIAFAPVLCEMLSDPTLADRYVDSLNRSIEFGMKELSRSRDRCANAIKAHLSLLEQNRREFVDIYERNILGKFDYFAARGFIEILATTATSCFLPLFADIPEALNAQIETGLTTYRKYFSVAPSGFWLPALGYTPGLEETLQSYGFPYTVLESHGRLFPESPAEHGLFAPAQCENAFLVFGRDKRASAQVADPSSGFLADSLYLDVDRDVGFELTEKELEGLFDVSLGRRATGFRYCSRRDSGDGERVAYDPAAALERAEAHAAQFLDTRAENLAKASTYLEGAPVMQVVALPASVLGQHWYEGVHWLETLYRLAASRSDVGVTLFAPHLDRAPAKPLKPFFSSWLESGYAEELLGSANDWMYPYVRKATERMIDLAERFPDDTGLKERALNMAAREVLLAQSMDWSLLMHEGFNAEYARARLEESVRAFTIVYESLGSNFISTEWLTGIEKNHNLFPEMNYRVFSKRK